jgi:hypothetical protein
MDNIDWDFVPSQKWDFLHDMLEDDEEAEEE